MELAPIVLFVYNRPWHTQQTIEALLKNELSRDSILYIYSDGPKNQEAFENVSIVRKYIRTISGFSKIIIIEREKNWGLTNNLIDGITNIVNTHGKIIVLEDDIVTTSGFLKYMNSALSMYENEKDIAQINGYIYPNNHKKRELLYLRINACWGWATWKDRWEIYEHDVSKHLERIKTPHEIKQFNINGAADYYEQLINNVRGHVYTWDGRWYASWFLNGKISVFPSYSFVTNIGDDNSGIHCSLENRAFRGQTIDTIDLPSKMVIKENRSVRKQIDAFYKKNIKKAKDDKVICLTKILTSVLFRFVPASRILFNNTISWSAFRNINSNNQFGIQVKMSAPYHITESEIGDYTYISPNSHISKTTIGKFCSIGPNLICGWGLHPTNGISTHPMFYSVAKQNGITFCNENKIEERKEITIGNDVFIGANVTILDGITIGDGAVIGAGTVVSKNIPPYAIAVGVPIKILKYRFDEETINKLRELKWWDMDIAGLMDVEQYFFETDVFINKYLRQ